jgi:hypothetical protein
MLGAVWLTGFWRLGNGEFVWIAGRWELPPGQGYTWVWDAPMSRSQGPVSGRWIPPIQVEIKMNADVLMPISIQGPK